MTFRTGRTTRMSSTVAAATVAGVATMIALAASPGLAAEHPALVCEKIAAKTLAACVKKAALAEHKCYLGTGAACVSGHEKVGKALDGIETKVLEKCTSDDIVRDAGYGPSSTREGLVERLRSSCTSEVASLVARSFGGPHAAVLAAATGGARDCLATAHKDTSKYLAKAAKLQSRCIVKTRKGGSCDVAKTSAKLDRLAGKPVVTATTACADDGGLVALVALDEEEFVARASAQGRCMAAIAHADPSPLELDCGPRGDIVTPPRGSYVQVVLDEATFGTRCGDGSSYAFWIRLAPDGHPVENVVVQMQGGGVCIFENDCASRPADLFEALSDPPETSGIMSNDELVSPFANWTKVYLPYCNQDVFIGGGTTSNFASVTVHRFGAVNTRAAMRYVRDVIWRELDQTTAGGYRADRPTMLFGGTSAGGFGTLFNYHWVLDDLQWAHTSAWPDAALSLDNGEVLGVAGLGILLIANAPPLGWGALSFLPPYCFANTCAVGPVGMAAASPRLKAVPEQQFLVLSNQVDDTQVSTTYFASEVDWINAARQAYRDTQGLDGVRYFLSAITASTHVIATREALYTGYSIGGEPMRDWLDGAIGDPDGVVDRVEEGTLTTAIPGVDPFPCTLP